MREGWEEEWIWGNGVTKLLRIAKSSYPPKFIPPSAARGGGWVGWGGVGWGGVGWGGVGAESCAATGGTESCTATEGTESCTATGVTESCTATEETETCNRECMYSFSVIGDPLGPSSSRQKKSPVEKTLSVAKPPRAPRNGSPSVSPQQVPMPARLNPLPGYLYAP